MTSLARAENLHPEVTHEAIASLFDGKFRDRALAIPHELIEKSQAEIEDMRPPNENDYRLRERLWFLVDQARETGATKIMNVRLYDGILTAQSWERVMDSSVRLAWLFKRPMDDKKKMQTHLQMLLQKVEREILPKAVTDQNLASFLKLLEFLVNRVHGPVVQRIESRNLNMDISGSAPNVSPASRDEILEKIKELESQINKNKVIDVTPE